MSEEEKIERYKNIINQLEMIARKIDNVSNDVSRLIEDNNNYMIVNNIGYKENYLTDAKNGVISVNRTIKEFIVPSLKNEVNN